MRTSASIRLPLKRTDPYAARIDRYRPRQLLWVGTLVYSIVPLAFACVDALAQAAGWPLVTGHGSTHLRFLEIFYFNWVTILTVGYGDYSPLAAGWIFAVFEALLGIGFFGVFVAIVTLKLLTPPRNTIVFSKYGYYCLEEQRFYVVFLNASRSVLVNPEMCSYYHLGSNGQARPAFRVPFIGQSVSVFPLEPMALDELASAASSADALRFGISVQLGLSTVSAFVEYSPRDIVVIPNREALPLHANSGAIEPRAPGFEAKFHYRPPKSSTLHGVIQAAKPKRIAV